jgi:hypothetical protein
MFLCKILELCNFVLVTSCLFLPLFCIFNCPLFSVQIWCNSFSIVARLWAAWLGFDSQQEQWRGFFFFFLFAILSSWTQGSTELPVPWVQGALSWGVKWLGHEAVHSPPFIAKVKNAHSCTSIPPYFFIVWCLVKHRDNFTSTLFFFFFQVPKSYSLNNQCEPSYSTLLQSGTGANGQVSPDKGQLYTNLPPPASSGILRSAIYMYMVKKHVPAFIALALGSGSRWN